MKEKRKKEVEEENEVKVQDTRRIDKEDLAQTSI